ncbi:MAG: hypothetical protein ACNA8P_00200 [Phycisphaerales bacterium]
MNARTRSTLVRSLSGASIVLLLAGSTLAQDAPRRGDRDAMRGPTVNDRAMPRSERFGESMMEGRQNAGVANYRLYVVVIKDLANHENPRLKLSDEQIATLTRIENAHQSEMRAYMQEARQQNEALRERVQRAREQAGDDREAGERIMERARARAEEIRAGAPKTDVPQARMWEVLTQPQRRFVTAELERRTDEQIAQRQQMQRERRGVDADRPAQRPNAGPDARPGTQERPGMRPGAGPETRPGRPGAERPDPQLQNPSNRRWVQMFERIQKLTPQQQERLFNMMNSTLDRLEASEAEAQQPARPAPRGDQPGRRGPGAGERPGAAGGTGNTDAPNQRRRPGVSGN